LAEKYNVKDSNVVIGPGVKYLFKLCIDVLLEEHDKACILSPNWLTYERNLKFRNIEYINFYEDKFFNIDFKKLKDTLQKHRIKVLIISNPNNPTGRVMSKKELLKLKDICLATDTTLIIDEVFSDLNFISDKPKSILDLTGLDDLTNIIVINSASKNYGMTGFRVGFAISNEDFIKNAISYIKLTITNVPEFIQLAYLAELKNDKHHQSELAKISEKYSRIAKAIEHSNNLKLIKSGGGITVFPFIKPSMKIKGFDFAKRLLTNKSISIVPGEAFNLPGFLRLSFAHLNNEQIDYGISEIDKFISQNT
jgi:aspartate/methionine/tyrosine aminotransferase